MNILVIGDVTGSVDAGFVVLKVAWTEKLTVWIFTVNGEKFIDVGMDHPGFRRVPLSERVMQLLGNHASGASAKSYIMDMRIQKSLLRSRQLSLAGAPGRGSVSSCNDMGRVRVAVINLNGYGIFDSLIVLFHTVDKILQRQDCPK